MTNKERLKNAIEQDMNPTNNYNKIIKKIEKGKKIKRENNLLKWSLIPICSIIAISGTIFLNYKKPQYSILFEKSPNEENNVTLNINNIIEFIENVDVSGSAIDITFDEIINEEDFIKNFKFLNKFTNSRLIKRYDINNKFIGYEMFYFNTNENEEITSEIDIFLSKTLINKPSCYKNIDFSKMKDSTINDTTLKILKTESNRFYALFSYNGYNFDIETSNITEQEFSDYLVSILR